MMQEAFDFAATLRDEAVHRVNDRYVHHALIRNDMRAMADRIERWERMEFRPGPEGPDDGHTFRIVWDSRGSYKVEGDEHHSDAPSFDGMPHQVEVRAWNLVDAFCKAANLPFPVLMGEEVRDGG